MGNDNYRPYTIDEITEIYANEGKFVFKDNDGDIHNVYEISYSYDKNAPLNCMTVLYDLQSLFDNCKRWNPTTKQFDLVCGMKTEFENIT